MYGCATETVKEETPDKETKAQISEGQEPEQIPTEPKLENKQCDNFDIPAQNLDTIDLTIFIEGLKRTEDSYKFRLIPLDKEGNIIPLTGNLKVSMWTTKEVRGKLTEDIEIYTKAFSLKEENVAEDCSSEEIKIMFDDIKASSKYKFVSEDESGIMRFEFKRLGSSDLFEKKYNAADFNEKIFP